MCVRHVSQAVKSNAPLNFVVARKLWARLCDALATVMAHLFVASKIWVKLRDSLATRVGGGLCRSADGGWSKM